MSTLTFDTLKYANRLKSAGVPESQANAEAEALRDVLSEALDASLSTKADVLSVKAELKTEMLALRTDIAMVKGDMGTLKWMMGMLIALAVANFSKQFF